MSRIGKLPIPVPAGVEVKFGEAGSIEVKGPKGLLTWSLPEPISASQEGAEVLVARPDDERDSKARHGLSRTLIANMITGVKDGYVHKMEIRGTGYRVQLKGSDLEFSLGYSHPVLVKAPAGVTFKVEAPTKFSVEGIDKQLVGQIAKNITKIRKYDPYKGKGVFFEGQILPRKAGKAGK